MTVAWPKAFYGLPEQVVFCKSCVISNQRPSSTVEFKHAADEAKKTIGFGEDGICDACRYHQPVFAILPIDRSLFCLMVAAGIADTVVAKANGFLRLIGGMFEFDGGAWPLIGNHAGFAEHHLLGQAVKGFGPGDRHIHFLFS